MRTRYGEDGRRWPNSLALSSFYREIISLIDTWQGRRRHVNEESWMRKRERKGQEVKTKRNIGGRR